MAELKSCPFCGRKPKVEDCGDNRYFVKCECGIEQSRLYGQKCDAVRRWNKRKSDQTDSEVTRNSLRTDCTGCRFVGTYDTEFPCANCVRKNKDYYDAEQTDCETCKYGQDKRRYAHICNECGVGINNYTPQTDCAWK